MNKHKPHHDNKLVRLTILTGSLTLKVQEKSKLDNLVLSSTIPLVKSLHLKIKLTGKHSTNNMK